MPNRVSVGIVLSMTFEDRCLKDFDSVVRARGEDDFRSRLVELTQVSATSAKFSVQGEDSKTICVGGVDGSDTERRGLLRVGCTCRSFEKGEFCQHVWAALLELDKRGTGKIFEDSFEDDQRVVLARLEPADLSRIIKAPVAKTSEGRPELAPTSSSLGTITTSGWKALLFTERREKQSSRRAFYFVNPERSKQTSLLTIELRYQERLKSGEWGAIKAGRFDPSLIDEFDDDQDREILGLLLSPINAAKPGSFEVDPFLMNVIVPKLAASERLIFGEQDPLTLGEGEWEFEIEVKDEKDGFRMEGVLRRDRKKIAIREAGDLVLLSSGFFLLNGAIERVEWRKNFDLARHLGSHSVFVPKKDEVDFVTSLAERQDLPSVQLPSSLLWPFQEAEPRAVARFQKPNDVQKDVPTSYVFNPLVIYDNLEIDVSAPRKVLLDPARRVRIKRDSKLEKSYLGALKGAYSLNKLRSEPIKAAEVPALIQSLQEHGWSIELERRPVEILSRMDGSLQKLGEEFVLDAAFDFTGEKVSLEAFFMACAKGERFLSLGGERVGFLPDVWIKRIDLLLRGAILGKDGTLRFRRSSLPLFRPVFEEIPGLQIDEAAVGVFAGLEKLNESGAAEKPRELKANLRPYQAEGLGWLERVAESGFGGILADDMGLGKTIQVISYLLRRAFVPRRGPRPSLVVLPKSLIFNWLSEIEKFGPRLRVLDFAGPNRGLLKAQDYDVVVTTYHVLKNELDRFAKIEFDSIILDEAQTIKNPGSQIAQAVFQLKGVHRFALTGTPIENSLLDLFSLMRFANPGLLPSGVVTSVGDGRGSALSKDALERLSIALSPFILRRTKKQVLTELPDKSEQALVCELEDDQKKMYDRLRRHYRDSIKKEIAGKGLAGSKMQVLEALLRLRQACCHPGLVDEQYAEKSSAKFAMLLEHLEEIRSAGHKALIFSQFTSLLGLLKPHLERAGIRYEYLDGQTRDRGAVVDRFNSNPQTAAFLISLKAGGTGLNLTTASYVFLLDPWWNPAVEAQAIDRAYRMGQKQKVMAYRLIAQGTIEEKIMRMQDQKRSLAEAVINEDQSFLRNLSVDDLTSLFE